MCVGIKTEEVLAGRCQLPLEKLNCTKGCSSKPKRKNNEERKEKAKDAARNRRTEEGDYFEELEKLLPVSGPPPSSQQTSLDKTSIIRLSVAHLKTQDVLQNGLDSSMVKEEIFPELDIFSCIDGFSLILSSSGDVIYVSDNVHRYIGLSQVELLGQEFSDYVHPCDHKQLKLLTPTNHGVSQDTDVEIFVRVKCTVTERGRMINLKQANYKPLKISGKVRNMAQKEDGGVTGTIFFGMVRCVVEREVMVDHQIGIFTTKHAVDMKILETDSWMVSVAGYSPSRLSGVSFFELVHALDLVNLQKAFRNLREQGQCETAPYRLLCYTGGYTWVQTKACLTTARRGCNKGQSISCSHHQISEVINREEILSVIQMKKQTYASDTNRATGAKVVQIDSLSQVRDLNKPRDILYDAMEPIKFEILDKLTYKTEINAKNNEKSVIIEPRKLHDNDQPILRPKNPRKEITATQTSVIVRCSKPESDFAAIPMKKKNIGQEERRVLKTATEGMFKMNDPVAITTESIFNTKSNTDSSTTSMPSTIAEEEEIVTIPVMTKYSDVYEEKDAVGKLWPKNEADSVSIVRKQTRSSPLDYLDVIKTMFSDKSTEEKKQIDAEETEFFDSLFRKKDHLENFAPHSGDQCISLGKNETKDPVIETVSFDDLVMLDFDDNFSFCTDFLGQPAEPKIDEDEVLIDPNRNAMWGSRGGDHPQGVVPFTPIWKEDDGKQQTSIDPEVQLNCHGILQGNKKLEFAENQDKNILELPHDKPVCRPKMYSMKRSNPSKCGEQYPISKKMRPAFGTTMHNAGFVTLDLTFDNMNSNIDILTII